MKGKHRSTDENTVGKAYYVGLHHQGVGLIPMGDRHRADYEFVAEDSGSFGKYEERDSLDPYSKYL